MSRLATRRTVRGFTLLEVLIALAIVALSAGALLGTITSSASNVSYLKDKTLSEWVALNVLTEIRIDPQFPAEGKRTGNTELGGMRWQWEQEVGKLPVEGMFRIDVRVRPTGETVDDSRKVDERNEQKPLESEASGAATEKLNWTTQVTGVIGSSRSPIQQPIAIGYYDSQSNQQGNQGGPNNPGSPGSPGTPGSPGAPGSPGTPVTPGPKPSPVDR